MRTKLRALRQERNLTIEETANSLHCSRSHYSQVEYGDKNPSLKLALRIKRFFDYKDDDIFLNTNAPNQGNEIDFP